MMELQIIYHVSINNDIVLISPLRIIGVLHVLISHYIQMVQLHLDHHE